jgi:translation initiation factor eIF-2B subunit beta
MLSMCREIILTLGFSRTVEDFLKAAARKRKITVVVAETAPFYHGRQLALSLSNANIPTLLVPDSAIFSLMSRISKVILGTHIVQADGSLIAITGSLPVCKVAKAHNVPVIVCTGMFKVSNMFMFAGATGEMGDSLLMEMDNAGPAEVLCRTGGGFAGEIPEEDEESSSMQDEDLINAGGKGFEVVAPYWDRVPQDLVSLFITNIGAHPPSMIFRLLKELFE